MKQIYKKSLLLIVTVSMVTHLSFGGWEEWPRVNAFKNWWNGEDAKPAEEQVQEIVKEEVDKDDLEEFVDLNAESKEEEEEFVEPEVDFYETLGIKFFPEKFLEGKLETLKKRLNKLFEKGEDEAAITYFISLERKDHGQAIEILETLKPTYRLSIMLNADARFIAKILSEMRLVDFKGKTLTHWGGYELDSDYFGKKTVTTAEIKGESVSLRYIEFLMKYNVSSEEDYNSRGKRFAEILKHTTEESLVSLLVYKPEEAGVKLGNGHEKCFGAIKSKGYCDEETTIYLPAQFVGAMINEMHKHKMMTNRDIVAVLEAEFEVNTERFKAIIDATYEDVLSDIYMNLSGDIIEYLPEDLILNAVSSVTVDESTLKIGAGSGYGEEEHKTDEVDEMMNFFNSEKDEV